MIKKLLAEFLGTMFFLYVILATGDAVAIGLALTVAIMVIGKHSGGHFNPAVYRPATLCAMVADRAGCDHGRATRQTRFWWAGLQPLQSCDGRLRGVAHFLPRADEQLGNSERAGRSPRFARHPETSFSPRHH